MIYDSKPWLKSYDTGVAFDIEIPDISLTEYFMNSFQRNASRTAFHYLGTQMTFGELMEASGRFASYLALKGLGKGDVVAINLPNTPQYVITMVGALRAGCAISGLAPLLMPDEMEYQLNNCNAKVLVTLDLLFNEKFLSVKDNVPGLKEILVAGIFDPLPDNHNYPGGQPIEGKSVKPFWTVMEEAQNKPPAIEISRSDMCYLQYTGGTTGPPKGAVLTHGNMVSNIYQFECWLDITHGKETLLAGFPMFHVAGLFISACGLTWGYTQILIPDPRDTKHITQEMKTHKPSFLANVPSLFLMLLSEPDFRKLDFSNLSYCLSGAAPFPVDKINELENIVGKNKMVEVWGMTETSPLITVNPIKKDKKIGSVGLPLPRTKFRIVDLETGTKEVPIGEEGELICCGPQVMKEYLNKPEETKKTIREIGGERWMYTGDVGKMDENGFVYVVDRAKDMLIVGGYKVFSSEVEDKLHKHPAIAMCAIIGLPNPERPDSEIVKLVIQKSEEYKDKPDGDVAEEIKTFAKKILAPYKVPKVYECVESIPLTSVGKIDKKSMRK